MTATTNEPIKVFDPSGKVREWLTSGRGVKVWQNIALDSASLGSLTFTPGDVEGSPDWKVRPLEPSRIDGDHAAIYYDAERFAFYLKSRVVARYSSSPQGFKAAGRRADLADRSATFAPIGRIDHAYTVEEVEYETRERIAYPLRPDQSTADTRPLDIEYAACVVEWVCLTPKSDSEERKDQTA